MQLQQHIRQFLFAAQCEDDLRSRCRLFVQRPAFPCPSDGFGQRTYFKIFHKEGAGNGAHLFQPRFLDVGTLRLTGETAYLIGLPVNVHNSLAAYRPKHAFAGHAVHVISRSQVGKYTEGAGNQRVCHDNPLSIRSGVNNSFRFFRSQQPIKIRFLRGESRIEREFLEFSFQTFLHGLRHLRTISRIFGIYRFRYLRLVFEGRGNPERLIATDSIVSRFYKQFQ